MKLSILKRTSHFRGDHSADVLIAVEVLPGETVEGLMSRVSPEITDTVEIRLVDEVKKND